MIRSLISTAKIDRGSRQKGLLNARGYYLFCAIIFFLIISVNSISQPIGLNYSVKDSEIVFKVILRPRQEITIKYYDAYYGKRQWNVINTDSMDRSFLVKDQIYMFTLFKISDTCKTINERIRYTYTYTMSGLYGDSILIDCRRKPFRVDAERLRLGQMNYKIDSTILNQRKWKTKDCDSAYYIDLEYRARQHIKNADDSLIFYIQNFREFRKSYGYSLILKSQGFSEAFSNLFEMLLNEKRMDTCYSSMLDRFTPYFVEFFRDSFVYIYSEENLAALNGYVLYNLLKNKLSPTIENAFEMIDSLLIGYYNQCAKLAFIKKEKNALARHKYLEIMLKADSENFLLKKYLIALSDQ